MELVTIVCIGAIVQDKHSLMYLLSYNVHKAFYKGIASFIFGYIFYIFG